jgi:excisionase family DNA binding protein
MSEASPPVVEKYYAPIEVASLLGVKVRTVLGWLRDPNHELVGNKIGTMWRVSHTDLKRYLERTRQ